MALSSNHVATQELITAEECDAKARRYRKAGEEDQALEYERCAKLARIQAKRAEAAHG